MSKIFKIILAIGGAIAGIFALFVSTQGKSKKEFNKRSKANDKKLEFITDQIAKVEEKKKTTKSNISSTSSKIKSTKSKLKNTQNAKSTIDDFEKKYRNKK
tara:strand:+ start:934 stop:1236 length:303 start_codon:yes stop_codon:yes gene_type:complete